MHASCSPSVSRLPTTRSAVSNLTRFLDGVVDGRSANARRFRDLIADFAEPFGGLKALTESDRVLVKQAAALALRAESMQAAIVNGEAVDHDALIRLSGEARRILSSIKRRAEKPKLPSLQDYITGCTAA
jgi:hypothetical protein